MVTIRRRSSGETSRPEAFEGGLSAGKKRYSSSQESASKRRRNSKDEDEIAMNNTETIKQKKLRNKKAHGQAPISESKASIDIRASGSRPGHVRFGSEEAELLEQVVPDDVQDDIIEEEDISDDDEAPEDVAAADAQATSTAAQRQAARAVDQQQAKAKKKRQEREVRLQEQAKSSTKPKRSKPVDLPDLLPEDILADEPFARPPTPPSDAPHTLPTNGLSVQKSIKFDDERPKDIQVGPVKVSVLQKQNKFLPPRANGKAKSIKEQWLAGRNGGNAQRQSVGGGFVRR